MRKNTTCSVNKKILIACLVLLTAIIFAMGNFAFTAPAIADEREHSSVLTDLMTDPDFDVADYPDKITDYSIQVIQIAESTDGELFVYTYQPSQKKTNFVATEINMSLSDTVDGTEPYGLTFLNSDGTLCKYKVTDLTVSDRKTRFYNITSIYRAWRSGIDAPADNDNTVTFVAFDVGQLWTVVTFQDTVMYEMTAVETLTVTKQMIGVKRYSDGFQWAGTKSCDAHYLLFSCDHEIDNLISADIAFYTQPYESLGNGTTYGDKTKQTAYLRYDDQVTNDGSGWFGKKEKWRRMASTEEFLSEVELSDEEKKVFKQYDWVLNFYETDYACAAGGKDVLITGLIPFGFIWTIINSLTTTGTIVSDVTLLRLEFDCNGEIYNLGVVSNRQTGSKDPIGSDGDKWWEKLLKWIEENWEWLVAGVVCVIILILLAPFLPMIFSGIATAIALFFKALWWIISAPFRLIYRLIHKDEE